MPINHDFWLFREGERAYTHYSDLLPRCDAPVSIDDEVLTYFVDTLEWVPTFNPAKNAQGNGLHLWGPTIIAQRGRVLFHHIFATWAQLFTYGPECFQLQGSFEWNWPFDTPEHLMNEEDLRTIGRYTCLKVERETRPATHHACSIWRTSRNREVFHSSSWHVRSLILPRFGRVRKMLYEPFPTLAGRTL